MTIRGIPRPVAGTVRAPHLSACHETVSPKDAGYPGDAKGTDR